MKRDPDQAELCVGIIGCGVVAPAHAGAYAKLPGVRLLWACDLIEDRARGLADRFRVPRVTTDFRRMLDDPELHAVSICTDHASHVEIAEAALEAGKHVLCEKALAPNTEGLDRMMEAGRRHPGLVFAGVFQHRFDRIYRWIKSLVDQGHLGRLLVATCRVLCHRTDEYYRADRWRGTWEREGGSVLINQAIHFVDLLQWIAGDIEAVAGSYANLTHQRSIETEDTVSAAVRFRNGALGTVVATSSSHVKWEPSMEFHGTAGLIELRHGRLHRVDFADAGLGRRVATELTEDAADDEAHLPGKEYYGGGHPAQIADFVDAIRRRRSPFIPAAEARRAVDVVLAAYRSHREQRWVRLGEPARGVAPQPVAADENV